MRRLFTTAAALALGLVATSGRAQSVFRMPGQVELQKLPADHPAQDNTGIHYGTDTDGYGYYPNIPDTGLAAECWRDDLPVAPPFGPLPTRAIGEGALSLERWHHLLCCRRRRLHHHRLRGAPARRRSHLRIHSPPPSRSWTVADSLSSIRARPCRWTRCTRRLRGRCASARSPAWASTASTRAT